MKVVIATIADCANISDLGKMNIMGVFRNIFSPVAPCRHLQFYVAIILRPDADQKGTEHFIQLVLRDADSKPIGQFDELSFTVPNAPAGVTPEVNLVIAMNQIQFPRFGDYFIDILIDRSRLHSIDLTVQPIINRIEG
jgi:hypothetical protein